MAEIDLLKNIKLFCLVINKNTTIKYHKKLTSMVVPIGTVRNTGINGIKERKVTVMRKITETREFNVYNFNELSKEAKERVRSWYLEWQSSELGYIFEDDCMERLKELFPDSDLKIQYSLNSCQGDGFNIYGEICLDELLEKIAEKFTEKELKFFKWAFSEYGTSYKMASNNYYCYCICSRNDFMEDIFYEMDDCYSRNIPKKTMEKFNKIAGKYLDNLCGEFEKDGYDWFYKISDKDLQEYCECNSYEFMEDGKLYTAA